MGYGEVGGDDSVQVSVHLSHPRSPEVDEGPPARVHRDADAQNQRSTFARGKANADSPGRAYRGQDAQSAAPDEKNTDAPWNVFTVTIHFSRQADLSAAIAALQGVKVPGDASFPLKIIRRAGQVHVSWPDEAPGGARV